MARGNNDPLTKRNGGSPVNSGAATIVNVQPGPREKSMKNKLAEPLGGAGASNYGDGAPGAHGTHRQPDPHNS